MKLNYNRQNESKHIYEKDTLYPIGGTDVDRLHE